METWLIRATARSTVRCLLPLVCTAAAALACGPSLAADPSSSTSSPSSSSLPPTPSLAPSWSGFYVGGHAGFMTGTTGVDDGGGANLFDPGVASNSFAAGGQLGYNWLIDRHWLLGLEAGLGVFSGNASNTCLQSAANVISANCKVTPRAFGSATARIGGVAGADGRTLIYGKGGLAWMRADVAIEANDGFGNFGGGGPPSRRTVDAWGWTLGFGLERAFASGWSVFAEYDYMRFAAGSMPTPSTILGTSSTTVDGVPSGSAGLSFNQHLLKLGFNYRFGARAAPASDSAAAEDNWVPGWEFSLGARYWYAFGTYANSNGGRDQIVSRLSYTGMTAHAGELAGRLDAPFGLFVKGIAGGGFITGGTMYDEDWGDATGSNNPTQAYSRTDSSLSGSMSYFTFDAGINLLRGPDHKVGPFIGYNRFQVVMSAFGCRQLVDPSPGVCDPTVPGNMNSISELDTWQSLRVGVSAEVKLSDRIALAGDVAWLPLVAYDGLDIHHLRQPVVYFPWQGRGAGVQAELLVSWQATDALSLGVGGRYWSLWTSNAWQTDTPTNILFADTQWYGVLLQASYRFGTR